MTIEVKPVPLSTALGTTVREWTLTTKLGSVTLQLREANVFEINDFQGLQAGIQGGQSDTATLSGMASIIVDGIMARATHPITETEVKRILKGTSNDDLEGILLVLMTGIPPQQGEDNPKTAPQPTGEPSSP